MTGTLAIMYAVAIAAAVAGAILLLRLRGPLSEQRVYAYRMVGIMAVALGVVLMISATAMWSWSAQP